MTLILSAIFIVLVAAGVLLDGHHHRRNLVCAGGMDEALASLPVPSTTMRELDADEPDLDIDLDHHQERMYRLAFNAYLTDPSMANLQRLQTTANKLREVRI